jgi:hypothetical protein
VSNEVVALDIDDVVVKHVEGFVKWSNETYGTTLTPNDYTEAWHELWDIDKEEVEPRKKLFFTNEVVGDFEVIEGAAEGLIALSSAKKVIGVTSRRESLRPVTERVLEELAPGAVSRVVFATYFRNGTKFTQSKADICHKIGARSLIDDHLKHCQAVNDIGVDAVLFGDYPWNQADQDLPMGIVRAADWPEVLETYDIIQ